MRIEHSWAVGIACLLFLMACGDAGTGVDAAATLEGSLALAQVDGAPLPITLRDGSAVLTSLVLQPGTASKTGDGWRLDFTATTGAAATHYFGRLDGSILRIVRREEGMPPLVGVDVTQLVFNRL